MVERQEVRKLTGDKRQGLRVTDVIVPLHTKSHRIRALDTGERSSVGNPSF